MCKKVPGTGEVARFPAETLGTHKDGNTEHNVTSNGAPHRHPRQRCVDVCVCGGGGAGCTANTCVLGVRVVSLADSVQLQRPLPVLPQAQQGSRHMSTDCLRQTLSANCRDGVVRCPYSCPLSGIQFPLQLVGCLTSARLSITVLPQAGQQDNQNPQSVNIA
jgi:hypothetical protein